MAWPHELDQVTTYLRVCIEREREGKNTALLCMILTLGPRRTNWLLLFMHKKRTEVGTSAQGVFLHIWIPLRMSQHTM